MHSGRDDLTRARQYLPALLLALVLSFSGFGLRGTATAATPAVAVSLYCYGNPELTRIANTTNTTITIRSLGSIYSPSTLEPISLGRRLEPGQAVWYQTGSRASTNVLTRAFIFDGYAGTTEGVRVVTSAGTFTRLCAYIPGYFPLHPATATNSQLSAYLPGTRRSEHLTLHYRPRSYASRQSAEFALDSEAAVDHIEAKLGVHWYGHEDYFLAYAITPLPDPGLRGETRAALHRIYQRYDGVSTRLDRQYIAAHELTHQISSDTIGMAASVMLSEGLAMYTGERYMLADGQISLDGFSHAALEQGKLQPIATLGDDDFYGRLLNRYPYDEAGSFVRYLIRTYGLTKFKRVYVSGNYYGVYGRSLSTLGEGWVRYLRSATATGPFPSDNAQYLDWIRKVQNGHSRLFSVLDTGRRVTMSCYRALDDARLAADRGDFATASRRFSVFEDLLPRVTATRTVQQGANLRE
ncbi:MAG: hypothetical protein M3281_02755 [Chloroflexota bacterium]|nr:hypothetical protein [Chloroflexota bacterium]